MRILRYAQNDRRAAGSVAHTVRRYRALNPER